MNGQEDNWVLVARVARPQGRHGEVLCDLFTDFPERFAERKRLWLRRAQETPEARLLETFWLPTGKSAGRVVLKFATVDSIENAAALAGTEVLIPEEERSALGDDEFYVSDLRGCTLVNLAGGDGPDELGTITDVHFPTTVDGRKLEHAAPVLVVSRGNGDEVLIPLAKEFLHHPDVANRRIEMRLPQGLVEANG